MQVRDAELDEQVQKSRQAIEALEPSRKAEAIPREVIFQWRDPAGQPIEKIYVQDELGMFPTQEFATLLTETLDSFIEGEMGAKLGDLFRGDVELPTTYDADSVNQVVDENIQIVKAFVMLVQKLPGFQLDVLCLSLGIPKVERNWAKDQMVLAPHRGGLTFDEGMDLLTMFIRQNANLIREKALGKARELVDVFQLEVLGKEPEDSSSSTDSKVAEEPASSTAPSPGSTPSSTSSPATPENV